MRTARSGRASFLSQSSLGSDPLTDFFVAVQRSYERAQEALDTAKSGYNLATAKTTITGSGGAREWNDQAFTLLKQAKTQGLITADDASILAHDVLGALGDIIAKALGAIETNEGPAFYWTAFQDSVASIVSNSVGWAGKKWHDLAKSYRIVDDYLNDANASLPKLEAAAAASGGASTLSLYKTSLGKLAASKTYMESLVLAAGIPLATLKDQAVKEDVSSLGAVGPGIVGTVIAGTITVGSVLKAIGVVLGIIGTGFLFEFYDVALNLIGLYSLVDASRRKKEALLEATKAASDKEKTTAEVSDLRLKGYDVKVQLDSTTKSLSGLARVSGLQDKADELKKKLDTERGKQGVPLEISEEAWFPWALAVGGGLFVAGFLYWYSHRKVS